MCPRKQSTEPKWLTLVSFFSGEVTSYQGGTPPCSYTAVVGSICRSVSYGPLCISNRTLNEDKVVQFVSQFIPNTGTGAIMCKNHLIMLMIQSRNPEETLLCVSLIDWPETSRGWNQLGPGFSTCRLGGSFVRMDHLNQILARRKKSYQLRFF